MNKIVPILILLSVFLASCGKQVTQVPANVEDTLPELVEETVSETVELDTQVIENVSAVYEAYSPEALAGASDDIVLFFNADWCSSCKAAEENIKTQTIPENLTLLDVDYDSNFELRKKYGVVAQHTFVQVDNAGNMIKKWVGGDSVEDIQGQLGKSDVTDATDLSGVYKKLTADDDVAAEVKAGQGRRVLFFHAAWCGTCKTTEANLDASGVPVGLSVFQVDFDTQLELNKQFGVTTKHTFVEVDKKMNKLNMWQGSLTVDDIIESLGEHKGGSKAAPVAVAPTPEVELKEEIVESPVVLAGAFAEYDESLVGKTDNTVVFFHADWCASCKALEAGINSEDIPENLTILKADFDSAIELRKKYGVVSQHTLVSVDADGNELRKWAGGNTLESITEKLN